MANKKVSQLTSKPSVLVTDLFPIADPTTGQLFKTTISALGTAIGSGVSSVNTLVGAVVLDTDDIQELASPTNRWYTDTRSRAALSASSPLVYNSGTGAFSIPAATTSVNGYLTSADWTTFNAKQAALSGTGFVKISGTTISYDNSTYLTTSAAASTYLALAGGTLTGALNGTSANFSGDLTLTGTNPRFYLTDSDNNPDYFISNTDGTFTVYDVTNSVSRLTLSTLYTTLNNTAKIEGDILLKQDSTIGPVAGYTTIASDSSGIFLRLGTASSHAYLILSSLTNYRNFTLPDATGTFALTSDLSAYLPLSGGTLTGNLNGTSASFNKSTNGTLGAIGSMTMGIGTSNDTTTKHSSLGFGYNAGTYYPAYIAFVNADSAGVTKGEFRFAVRDVTTDTAPTVALTIQTSGAATFTSTITATGATLTGALSGTSATFSGRISATGSDFHTLAVQSGSAQLKLERTTTSAGLMYIGADVDGLKVFNSSFTTNLLIASTGAATFSSSVTAGGIIRANASASGQLVIQAVASDGNASIYLRPNNSGFNLISSNYLSTSPYLPLSLSARENTSDLYLGITGNVGIGTATPNYPLEVNGDIQTTNLSGNTSRIKFGQFGSAGTSYTFIQADARTSGYMAFYTDVTPRMTITSGGNVLVGTTSDVGARLHVSGNLVASGTSSGNGLLSRDNTNTTTYGFVNNGSGSLTLTNSGVANVGSFNMSTGVYTPTSDINKKKDFEDSTIGLNEVLQLKPTLYRMKTDKTKGQKELGFIAQEVKDIIPNAYVDNGDFIGINFNPIVAALTKAVQEQQVQIQELKKQLENK
jgi:hypothetical protein